MAGPTTGPATCSLGLIVDATECLNEADRRMTWCDQCGPAVNAKMHGIIGDHEIKWCYHCANLNAKKFNADGGFLYEIRAA